MDLTNLTGCMGEEKILLAEHSSYGIGGKAKQVAFPKDKGELFSLLEYCREKEKKYFIFGYGANILFPDTPPDNLVYISLKHYQWLSYNDGKLFLAAGVPLSFLALLGLVVGNEDLAFTYLLPGSIGGGTYINARCLDKQMSDLLCDVHFIDLTGKEAGLVEEKISREDCDYSYKSSIFQGKSWLISGIEVKVPNVKPTDLLRLNFLLNLIKMEPAISSLQNFYSCFSRLARSISKGDLPESFRYIEELRAKSEHFKYPSCGSVFKNNYSYGVPMGILIDRLGLKGVSKGGAMISPYHGNFIVNMQEARASDVVYLINLISRRVQEAFGFTPELEVVNLESRVY